MLRFTWKRGLHRETAICGCAPPASRGDVPEDCHNQKQFISNRWFKWQCKRGIPGFLLLLEHRINAQLLKFRVGVASRLIFSSATDADSSIEAQIAEHKRVSFHWLRQLGLPTRPMKRLSSHESLHQALKAADLVDSISWSTATGSMWCIPGLRGCRNPSAIRWPCPMRYWCDHHQPGRTVAVSPDTHHWNPLDAGTATTSGGAIFRCCFPHLVEGLDPGRGICLPLGYGWFCSHRDCSGGASERDGH